ncbi:hypothetical protein B9Z55_015127 [Caenorhabditis nigoni]|uniref:Uncharacterized protein n=1 Tax=Caenorhabditis nigoni TaxID=1611254 RepID=A0A2G5U8T5_9PELO|nr:hypothetical protein B9Z55_015127 [Caenorhabditis nigoni]
MITELKVNSKKTLPFILILFGVVICQESTTVYESTTETDQTFKYDEDSEREFLILFWFLITVDLCLSWFIGFMILAIRNSWKRLMKPNEEIKIETHETHGIEIVESPPQGIADGTLTAETKDVEDVNKKDKKSDERRMPAHCQEEWTPVPDDFKEQIIHKEMGPITITTHNVADKDIFVDQQSEKKTRIANVQINDEILVYEVGVNADVVDTQKSIIGGSSGGSTILTASIREFVSKKSAIVEK